jgi:acyl dehydratase
MAVVLAYPGFWMRRPEFGIDWRQVLHVDQLVTIHAPLPVEGHVTGVTTLESTDDWGAERGVLVRVRREICDADSGAPLATIVQGSLLRGNGGFAKRRDSGKRWPAPPERPADRSVALGTRPEQALLYRLLGDDNPLHADPEVARGAGFDRPILHGLCTFGVAGRAIVKLLCDDDPRRLRSMGGRFTTPVYPGETIVTEVWRTGDDAGIFRASVLEREVVALDCGVVELA